MAKRYSIWFLTLAILGLVTWFGIVIFVDPYRVFGLSGFNEKNFEPNTRYLKVEYLRRTDVPYTGFVFGASRANFWPMETLEAVTGQRYYNFNVSKDQLSKVFDKARWVAARFPMRQAVVVLDYDMMFLLGDERPGEFLLHEHYLVTGGSRLLFYAEYLTISPRTVWNTIAWNKYRDKQFYLFDAVSGLHTLRNSDLQIAAGTHDFDFRWRQRWPTYSRFDEAPLVPFARLLDMLSERGIETTLVLNPYNHLRMNAFDLEDYIRWLSRITQIADGKARLFDFSGFNPVTVDNTNYYEDSHYLPFIGDRIIRRIFADEGDFGFRLSLSTLPRRVEDLKRERREYLAQRYRVGKAAVR